MGRQNTGRSKKKKKKGDFLLTPVSYTHLDVYKRQAVRREMAVWKERNML